MVSASINSLFTEEQRTTLKTLLEGKDVSTFYTLAPARVSLISPFLSYGLWVSLVEISRDRIFIQLNAVYILKVPAFSKRFT